MRIPTLLLPALTIHTTRLSGLAFGFPLMMPTTQSPQVVQRIIITNTITTLMVNLVRRSATQSDIAKIILHRPLATIPITPQHKRANLRPIRIETLTPTRTRPHHDNHQHKQGWPVLSRRANQRGNNPQQEKFSDQPTQVLQEGIEPSRHRTTHFEYAASTIPPPKQKNRQPPCHTHQNMGIARHLTQTAIRKSNGKKWLFTASHGARMLRESNPRTVPSRHLSKVVQ